MGRLRPLMSLMAGEEGADLFLGSLSCQGIGTHRRLVCLQEQAGLLQDPVGNSTVAVWVGVNRVGTPVSWVALHQISQVNGADVPDVCSKTHVLDGFLQLV